MELTQAEENRNRAISATATLLIFALFILFLILFKLITPNPPFPEVGGGGGQELALGMMDMGNSDMDFSSMGKVTAVVTEKSESKENVVTDDGGEAVNINEKKPEIKENKMVITPVKPKPVVEPIKEKTAAEKLAEKFKKNTGQNGGGIGDNDQAGQNGSPDGDPFKNGTGGSGTGTGGGNGQGDGPGGPGPGSGGGPGGRIGIDLKGRAVVSPPKIPSDTKEEGKVVVEITVDSKGDVIEANPNGRGTTTSSALLKSKAKQAAMATKFNVDGKFEEQKGTITIIFSFN
ncbi:energy transducer TonB family protein [Aurantibacillus circumpalustris]|uniref:energy transducer TonB family protein n=1 Tax=Aurantibacillus circumpalustris TaxID=3036359 RepID=UPI00295B9488|nr:energy transducer TonB [Aurantibacillus circumpalustris]